MGIFNIDNPLNKALGKIADMVLLSTLWLVCCLPVVTIGASTTALYYACMKNHLEEGTNFRNFFHAFKRDLVKSLALELIVVLMAAILVLDFYVLPQLDIPLGGLVQVILTVCAAFCIAALSYLFPLLARYDTTIRQMFKNAFLMSLMNLHYSILIFAVNCIPLLILILDMQLFIAAIPIVVLIWPGMSAMINAKTFLRIFKKYEPEEEKEEICAEAEVE